MRTILLFLFTAIFSLTAAADTFTVTSNADSGPGTLRQALLDAAANGSAVKDYIYFNIADLTPGGLTIAVQTKLPDVTGNVIIDASTQPGPKFGVSDAHIAITTTQTTNDAAFNISNLVRATEAVEFYGLYIYGFNKVGVRSASGIMCNAACKLVIGAKGKGNVICTTWFGIVGTLTGAIIQSNFIGVAIDGTTLSSNTKAIITNGPYDGLLIGGSNQGDGNVISNEVYQAIDIYSGATPNSTVNIINNFFGTNNTGTLAASNFFLTAYIQVNAYSTTVNVSKNVFNANSPAISGFNQCNFVIKGNFFGTDKTNTAVFSPLSHNAGCIGLNSHVTATVGGDNPDDQNVFANYGQVFNNINFSTLEVIKNSFRCNQNVNMQDYSTTNYTGNYLRILDLTNTHVSGEAPPGATVQLYFVTNVCLGYCNPDTWFANVTANSSGVWEYNGSLPYHVMATSTYNHSTYGVEPAYILPADVTITNIDCNHAGSIEINKKRTGKFTFVWKDANRNVLANTSQKLDNLTTGGTYYLEVSEDGSCPTATGQFTLTDLRPHILPQSFTLDCNHTTYDFSVYLSNVSGTYISSYHWLDKDMNEISTQSIYRGAGAGVYYVYVIDNNNCKSETVKYEVKPATNNPVIDETNVTITDADCNSSNGSVVGLKVSGGTNGLYGWVNNNTGATIYNQYNLINAAPGTYHFFENYGSTCVAVSKNYTVGSKNGITMDVSHLIVTPVSCNGTTGGIKGMVVSGATTYGWYNTANPNILVGTTIDLMATQPGNYYLVASNAAGCTKQSSSYAVSGFTNTDVYGTGLTKKLVNATCGNNGSIEVIFEYPTGLQPSAFRWVNHATGETLAGVTTAIATNLDAGSYDIYVSNAAGCERFLYNYSISRTGGLSIVATNVQTTNDNCNSSTGSVTGLAVNGATGYTVLWADANGKTVGTSLDLKNIPAGDYTVTVTAADKSCPQTYGPVKIANTANTNINQSNPLITSTLCGQSTGTITNITVTGGTPPYKFSWKSDKGVEVATSKDLTGQPVGTYTLTVSDASTCPPVATSPIAIPEINGITMTDTGTPTQADCSGNGGSVTGIQVTGATVFNWFNSSGSLVGTRQDLTGVAAGSYYLTASNASGGCTKTSKTYTVTQQGNTDDYGAITVGVIDASCGENKGSIAIDFTGHPAVMPSSYRWVNQSTQQTIKTTTTPALDGLDGGNYDVYVTNATGCERLLTSALVVRIPALAVDTKNVQIVNDQCGSASGSITGLQFAGKAPVKVAWNDDSGKFYSSSTDVSHLSAGNYHVQITDGVGCTQGFDYTITNQFENLVAPDIKDLQLCGSGNTRITVLNTAPGYTYRLYNNAADTDPIDVQTSGVFSISVKTNRSYYVSKSLGECESSRAELKVTVGITSASIANTFSPNGDGVNDYWKIAGIENYPNAQVQIFTRAGQKIFESNGYAVPFDGAYQGKQLPVGTYYYIINLNSGCSLLSGSITIVR